MSEERCRMKISTIKIKTFLKKEGFYNTLSFILLVLVWKIISLLVGSEIIFPSPEDTFVSVFKLFKSSEFFLVILSSIKRGFFGFLMSLVLGIIFGFLAGFNKTFRKIFEPFMIVIRTIPIIALILIALIWFKADNVPIFASFLIAFPIIYVNTVEGIRNTDIKLIQMSKIYNIRKLRVITEIYLPSLFPFLISAVSTAVGTGWKVVIAAEVLSQPKYAIGTSLQTSKIYLNINDVFAWIIIAIFIGYIFERVIRLIGNRLVKWNKDYVS